MNNYNDFYLFSGKGLIPNNPNDPLSSLFVPINSKASYMQLTKLTNTQADADIDRASALLQLILDRDKLQGDAYFYRLNSNVDYRPLVIKSSGIINSIVKAEDVGLITKVKNDNYSYNLLGHLLIDYGGYSKHFQYFGLNPMKAVKVSNTLVSNDGIYYSMETLVYPYSDITQLEKLVGRGFLNIHISKDVNTNLNLAVIRHSITFS